MNKALSYLLLSLSPPSSPVVDHGCAGVQWTGNLLWDEDSRLALHEALPVAGALEHPHLQVRTSHKNIDRFLGFGYSLIQGINLSEKPFFLFS